MNANDQETPSRPNPGMFRHALIFGGGAGVAVIVWNLLEFAFGIHGDRISWWKYTGLASMMIPVAAIVIGLIHWRDKAFGGLIRFRDAFGCGLAIGLVFSATLAVFSWIYVGAINPGVIEAGIALRAVDMQEAGSTAEEIQKTTDLLRAKGTPGGYAFNLFALMLISLFFVSLFAAILLRRRHSKA
ncbi:MAG: DUF4199 domain-containing protein [Opitutaceae bacterium]